MIDGIDTVDGETGTDMISFVGCGTSINANLVEGCLTSDRTKIVSASNFDSVAGTSGNHLFRGDAVANWFRDLGGRDSFFAGAGGDIINGDQGTDVAIHGYDRDQWTVTEGTDPVDRGAGFVEYICAGDGDGVASAEILRFADGDFLL